MNIEHQSAFSGKFGKRKINKFMQTIDNVILIKMRRMVEPNGILTPVEFDNGSLFKPKRVFFVQNVPDTNPRGCHAHFKTKQILCCVSGHISCKIHDGFNSINYELYSGDALFVPNMIWDEQIYHSTDTVLFSICSTHYNADDYIHNFNEFVKLKANARK
jgi:UDP-2-acetamido-3-amino-2,3-dideoxy-glucuronate N-acetyltransferase